MNSDGQTVVLSLIGFSVQDERRAMERSRKDRESLRSWLQKVVDEAPALHKFLMRVNLDLGPECVRTLWFRIWAQFTDEEERGIQTTFLVLRKLPDIDDRAIDLNPSNPDKALTCCIEKLDELMKSA